MWTLTVQNSDELMHKVRLESLEKCMTFDDIFLGLYTRRGSPAAQCCSLLKWSGVYTNNVQTTGSTLPISYRPQYFDPSYTE